MLIRCDSASWHFRENGLFETCQPRPRLVPFAVAGKKSLVHPPPHAVVAEVEGAILTYHAFHRPHTGDVIAPSCGPTRNRHRENAGRGKALERSVGRSRQAAVRGQSVVDIQEHTTHIAAHIGAEYTERLHR